MAPYEGDGFSIEHRWKEEVVYREGPDEFVFDGGWGVIPPSLYVPDATTWAQAMPEWMRDRRDLILKRLAEPGTDNIIEGGYSRESIEARSIRRQR